MSGTFQCDVCMKYYKTDTTLQTHKTKSHQASNAPVAQTPSASVAQAQTKSASVAQTKSASVAQAQTKSSTDAQAQTKSASVAQTQASNTPVARTHTKTNIIIGTPNGHQQNTQVMQHNEDEEDTIEALRDEVEKIKVVLFALVEAFLVK